jgi:hypothetical protein
MKTNNTNTTIYRAYQPKQKKELVAFSDPKNKKQMGVGLSTFYREHTFELSTEDYNEKLNVSSNRKGMYKIDIIIQSKQKTKSVQELCYKKDYVAYMKNYFNEVQKFFVSGFDNNDKQEFTNVFLNIK